MAAALFSAFFKPPSRPSSPVSVLLPEKAPTVINHRSELQKSPFLTNTNISPNASSSPRAIPKRQALPPSPVVSPVPSPPAGIPNTATVQKTNYGKAFIPVAPVTGKVSPLLRIPVELLVEIVGKHPSNLTPLRRTCKSLWAALDATFLLARVPVSQVGLLAAGQHAVTHGCTDIPVLNRLLDDGTAEEPLLEWCCLLNRIPLVQFLTTDRRPRPVPPTPKAICWASSRGHIRVVRTLLDRGAVPTEECLRAAARNHHIPVVRLLLERGAEPTSGALECALRAGHIDLVQLLLDRGAPPNDDVLSQAAYQGFVDVVCLLLEKGAVVTERAVDYACWGGNEKIIAMFEDRYPYSP